MKAEFNQNGSKDFKVYLSSEDIYHLKIGKPIMAEFQLIKNGKTEVHKLLICTCLNDQINNSRKLLREAGYSFGNGPHAIISQDDKIHQVHLDIEFIQDLNEPEEDKLDFWEILLDEVIGTKLILRYDAES